MIPLAHFIVNEPDGSKETLVELANIPGGYAWLYEQFPNWTSVVITIVRPDHVPDKEDQR